MYSETIFTTEEKCLNFETSPKGLRALNSYNLIFLSKLSNA